MEKPPDSSSQILSSVASGGASPPSLTIVVDEVRTRSVDHFGCFSGFQWEMLRGKILRAGFSLNNVSVHLLKPLDTLNSRLPREGIILGLGEQTLRHFTEKKSVDKWQLSPLTTNDGRKFIPTFDLGRLQVQHELWLYVELAVRRAHEEASTAQYSRHPERFRLNPPIEETLAVLRELREVPDLSVDVETGYGQINTVGFAWSPSDAIAINVLPDRLSDHTYFELWRALEAVLRAPSRKIFQNFIYDDSYFSAYGVRVENIAWDTMWAMKVLWPEFPSNLGNVGRIYTKRPYWKDDGKVESEEGSRKDWGNVRDWTKHYLYNCRDTTGTFEASLAQREDMRERTLEKFFESAVLRLIDPVREMVSGGMPLDLERRDQLKSEVEARIEALTKDFQAKAGEVNPRSPKQVLAWLKRVGVKLPKVSDKKTGDARESADAKTLKKIRLTQDRPGLFELQQIKTLGKALSSYINFEVRPDGKISYSLNACGTETLRFSGGKDGWGRGFNIQTIPREGGEVSIKSMFVAPPGYTFIEADLKAAETWYVAYDSVCTKMIEMLHSGEDIHGHVAYAILRALGKPDSDYSKMWRNLAKKTGHGSNYMMKEGTFVENVFKDMDVVLSRKEGKLILESYFGEFPEIRERHGTIKRELYNKRKLVAPTGWERYFYGRWGDDMLREAVAWAPQHTVPWVINHMMFYLCEERKRGNLEFHLLTQTHDALYLLVRDEWLERTAKACSRVSEWHPKLVLTGGTLQIPIEIEIAKCLATKEAWHEQH